MGKGPVLTGLILLVIAAGGAFALVRGSNDTKTTNPSSASKTSTPGSNSANSVQGDTSAAATITYNGTGFSPTSTIVKSGDKVTIKNTSSNASMQYESDPHPVHTDDTELNAGDVDPGSSKTFTVTKKGTFGYHNHYDQSQRGQITIQ